VWWSTNRTDQDAVIGEVTTYNQKTAGGIVGGQLGYNWARCNTLLGVEVDGDWSSAERTTQLIPNTPGVDVHLRSRFDAIWTARSASVLRRTTSSSISPRGPPARISTQTG
jgi:hypothetical protein